MMSSLVTFLLLAATDPAAASAAAAECARKSGSIILHDRVGGEARTAAGQPGVAADGKDAAARGGKSTPQLFSASARAGCPAPGARMAIDEVGMPVDKKEGKGKGVATGDDRDCDGADAACRSAGDNRPIVKGGAPGAGACAAQAKIIVDTYGGHGAHGAQAAVGAASSSSSAPSASPSSSSSSAAGCPAPAGMAINEKGTATGGKKDAKTSK